jgi:predicted ferric reductase
MFVITPTAMLAVYAFIAMPSFIAVNAAYSWLVTQLLGMMTIVLGVAVLALIVSLVLNRSPFALDDKEPRTSPA